MCGGDRLNFSTISEGAMLVEKDEQLEAINLEFVLRIREYPKNKKGKKNQ